MVFHKRTYNHRRSDNYSLRYDAPPPKLASLKQIRKANDMREELNGEKRKREISKVTLPKFSWEKNDDEQT